MISDRKIQRGERERREEEGEKHREEEPVLILESKGAFFLYYIFSFSTSLPSFLQHLVIILAPQTKSKFHNPHPSISKYYYNKTFENRMAPRRIKDVIGAVKDQTSIGLAKVAGSSSLSDLEVAVVKATRHGQNPPNQCYVAEILSLTSYSRAMVNSCVSIIARRLNRTKNWVVALKSLLLVQRLLSQGGAAFEQEIFFTTRRGTRFLNLCDFRDSSRSAWDYSAFVRTYALYLDELLEFRMQGDAGRGRDHAYNRKAEEDEEGGGDASNAVATRATPVSEMETEAVFCRADHLMQLLERFLACKPTGAAKHNRIVIVALYPILKESFQIYDCITEVLGTLIDRFMQMEVPDMMQVHDIFSRVSNQYDELDSFYNWCKNVGIMRFPEYPNVEKISQPKLDMMNDFIRHKSAMLHSRRAGFSIEPRPAPVDEAEIVWAEPPKALSPIKEETIEEVKAIELLEEKKTQEEGDLLNLYDDNTQTSQDFGDRLALALFDTYPSTTEPASTIPPWAAFKDSESGDWETALVQSASHLSNQKPSLPQGFDPLVLDGMYQHGTMAQVAASSGFLATASASSVALGSAGSPAMLALPPPPTATFSPNNDPFAASLAIAPPAYVQMSELEKKQRLLEQEQQLWQQYARDGMHGQVGLAQLQQQNSYQYYPQGVYAAAW